MSIDIIVTILLVVCFIFSSWHKSRLTLPVKTAKKQMFCPFFCHFLLICQPHSAAVAQKLKDSSLFANNQLSRVHLPVSSTIVALGLTIHYKNPSNCLCTTVLLSEVPRKNQDLQS